MNTPFDAAHLSRFLALATLTFCGGVDAADRPPAAAAPRYIVGGVTDDERGVLRARIEAHSLWLITAASKTGAYLVDVDVQVRDERQRLVFDERLAGPWLLIDLPPGRYEIRALSGGQAQRRVTTIHAGDHRQVIFYFDTEGEVLPRQ